MARPRKPSFVIANNMDVIRPQKERALPIPQPEWNFLRKKIEAIAEPNHLFSFIGSFLLGVSSSAFVAALTVPTLDDSLIRSASWITFLVAGVLSCTFLYIDNKVIRSQQRATKSNAIDEMNRLEARFPAP